MRELMILAAEEANAATVVNEFEELLLRIFVVTIMFGLGAGLTPKDFGLNRIMFDIVALADPGAGDIAAQ